MTVLTNVDLYERGCKTLLASWAEYARGAVDARLLRLPGVVVGMFPHPPERSVYNNALFGAELEVPQRARAVDAMRAAYADAGIDRFAAWVHEFDRAMRTELERRGYTVDITTLAMGMELTDLRLPRPTIAVGPARWPEYLRYEGLPENFLAQSNHAALRVLAARDNGEVVAAALAYDHGQDCGIYNVGTLERARHRGLGTAVTLAQLYAARDRGCRTASLQSTPMAEHLYARLGFRDCGRIIEYVPAQ